MEPGPSHLTSARCAASADRPLRSTWGSCCSSRAIVARAGLTTARDARSPAASSTRSARSCSSDCEPAAPAHARRRRQRPRRPVAHRPPAPRPAVPRLGHGQLHLRRARPDDVRAARRARRVGPGQRRAQGRAHAHVARRQRLPVAEPLARDQAAAQRQRRGQGREGRRLAVGLSRPEHEVPGHRRPRPGRRHRRRRPPAAEPGRPEHDHGGESVQLSEDFYAGINAKGSLPRAPARDGLRRGAPRVQRRQAHQPDDGAGDGRRLATSSARRSSSASATRTSRSRWATARTSPTASCTRSTSTSPTRRAGTPTRRS